MPSAEFESEIENDKNKNLVLCKYCKSKILLPKSAAYVSQEKNLPLMTQKKTSVAPDCEELLDFWEVDDMYTFENIGFSLTIDNMKYLICADCEMGPVGYHDLSTKKSFVALARIEHKDSN